MFYSDLLIQSQYYIWSLDNADQKGQDASFL